MMTITDNDDDDHDDEAIIKIMTYTPLFSHDT